MKQSIQLLTTASPTSQSELKTLLLTERQIENKREFFSPPHPLTLTLKSLDIDPAQVKKLIARLTLAKQKKEKVVIFGDYDADGLSATTILWQFLHQSGLKVTPLIPHRHQHGYGLNERSVKYILQQQPSLVVTVDNGIVAGQAIAQLINLGIDVLVTDHHQPVLAEQPQHPLRGGALALVHTTQLCGASVAWLVAREIGREWVKKKFVWTQDQLNTFLEQSLDLTALASIADQVPLLGANRSFVVHGLAELKKATRPGIQALCRVASIDSSTIDEWKVGFGLAPRLNAMGRLGEATEALRLLCSHSPTFALKRAQLLETTNRQRQDLTHDQLTIARSLAKKQTKNPVLAISSPEFHEGIIGLLAGKLTEETGKPTLVMAVNEVTAKGSARSIAGFDVTEFLRSLQSYLLELGGHPLAAGFSLDPSRLEEFASAVANATQSLKIDTQRQLSATCHLPDSLLTEDTVATVASFSPFGMGNPKPEFLFNNLKLISVKAIGSQKQHLKAIATLDSGQAIDLLSWNHDANGRPPLLVGQTISCLGQLEANEYRGRVSLSIKVSHFL